MGTGLEVLQGVLEMNEAGELVVGAPVAAVWNPEHIPEYHLYTVSWEGDVVPMLLPAGLEEALVDIYAEEAFEDVNGWCLGEDEEEEEVWIDTTRLLDMRFPPGWKGHDLVYHYDTPFDDITVDKAIQLAQL